jgi:hypothetical protein
MLSRRPKDSFPGYLCKDARIARFSSTCFARTHGASQEIDGFHGRAGGAGSAINFSALRKANLVRRFAEVRAVSKRSGTGVTIGPFAPAPGWRRVHRHRSVSFPRRLGVGARASALAALSP